MFNLQKAGGIAAVFASVAYVVGFSVMATLLNPGNTHGWSTAQKLAFVLERKALFDIWNLIVYVGFSIALVVLTVAIHDRLKDKSLALMQIATPFGLIWAGLVIGSGMIANVGLETVAAIHARDVAQATSTWVAIDAIQNGLGGGVEIVGGVWVLLISVAAQRSRSFPRALTYLGITVGLIGVLTVLPVLKDLAGVFGLIQIPWFAWIGIIMLRQDNR
jgi:hypothetical protein